MLKEAVLFLVINENSHSKMTHWWNLDRILFKYLL